MNHDRVKKGKQFEKTKYFCMEIIPRRKKSKICKIITWKSLCVKIDVREFVPSCISYAVFSISTFEKIDSYRKIFL